MTDGPASSPKSGPLTGFTIIEMAGLGPVPLAGLILSEMGARVVRVERKAKAQPFLALPPQFDLDRHGREIVRIDLKQPEGIALLLRLASKADVLLEGFRPGVMERIGAGPEPCLAANPGLVYGRMTGFGQEGPLAQRAGHDLTYLAMTGVLNAIGPRDGKPVPPLNLVADYGGGAMFLIAGVLAALLDRGRSGKGQVVDAAMIDGVSMLAAPFFGYRASGIWQDRRGSNLLDSGTPFYDTYRCADGLHVAVACLEPQFFAEFARLLPLDPEFAADQYDTSLWPGMRAMIEERIGRKTRDEWTAIFAGSDACVAPVLSFDEAADDDHNRRRGAHVKQGKLTRPAPAPRFSRTQSAVAGLALNDARTTLSPFGLGDDEIDRLAKSGVIGE